MRERTEELINQIGGERGKLSPEKERDEAAAMKELGERLGMTGFESSDKESRLERAKGLGQDPSIFLMEARNRVRIDFKKALDDLKDFDSQHDAIYPQAGESSEAMAARTDKERAEKKDELQIRLDQLEFERERSDDIVDALENGDTTVAAQELERQINRAERGLAELDQQAAEAEQDVRYINLMEHSANARALARQAKTDWPDVASVHEQAASLYAKQATELVGLDKLRTDKDSRSRDIKNLRAMVKNLELYKK